jgi:hypothetical protein
LAWGFPSLCIAERMSVLRKRPTAIQATGEATNGVDEVALPIDENDVFMARILKTGFEEDITPPAPPAGFVKVLDHRVSVVRKSVVINALYFNREKVSVDRMRRFITNKKNSFKKADHVFIGGFVKMTVDQAEEYCQVISFRMLTGKRQNLVSLQWPLKDEHGKATSNVGVLVNLFKYDSLTGKISYLKALIHPINLREFIRHVEYDEMYKLLSVTEDEKL